MIAILKKFWWVAVGIAVLCFFLWKGCKPGPDHSADKSSVDSINAAFTVEKAVLLGKIIILSKDDSAKDHIIDSLKTEKAAMQRDLAQRGKAIDQTIQSGKDDRARKDTMAIVINCDSLVNQVIADQGIIGGYELLTDSLQTLQQSQATLKDAVAANWKDLFLHADTARAYTENKYNGLYSDYVKVNRKLKFTNLMGKVGAGAIAVLATLLIIKK